ncbi:MaoC family dehydratase N-terminal domain-containing protein [Ammoniphilus sp. YIM 78166]|uniref:FAS1-like dehydratase domain-containing protein n=1 Tax=Ammoniphilus sp. YIM 78166 TaxID=1644106 RepID=UPI0010705963|nr:MaoC family dehydratase N-terminal domain-containing protein [Ammoniphilus sp. YIM 78166]
MDELVGFEFEPYTFTIERGKIKEFAKAIGDIHPAYLSGDVIPPTFPTAVEMWGGVDFFTLIEALNLHLPRVLHGEQEYEYFGKVKPGDVLRVNAKVIKAYQKSGMKFVVIESIFRNEKDEVVIYGKSTLIERPI